MRIINQVTVAARALRDGKLVAFPTETVYGLGADATNSTAVARIYSTKGRPQTHPLIIHISSADSVSHWARNVPDYAIHLAKEFWPGPMTLILPRTDLAKDFVTGGQNNVGLRVPAQQTAQELMKNFEELGGMGIAAPSANRFGAVSPTSAEAVSEDLAKYLDSEDLVLDDGPCLVGIESTIIDCTGSAPKVLRPGALTVELIERALNIKIDKSSKSHRIKAPGLLETHYSPRAKILLDGIAVGGDGFLALARFPTPPGAIRLASPKTVDQYASELYAAFRNADKQGLTKVFVIAPEGNGLAEAIRDRLKKASSR